MTVVHYNEERARAVQRGDHTESRKTATEKAFEGPELEEPTGQYYPPPPTSPGAGGAGALGG